MNINDLDALIDEAAVYGELSTGSNRQWLAAQDVDGRLLAVLGATGNDLNPHAPYWTDKEDDFLRSNYMWLTDDEIGQHLGRSKEGVHIRRERELRLPGRTNHPDWFTAQTVKKMLGMRCAKSIVRLISAGILPGRLAPAARDIYLVNRQTLNRWAVNPDNWIYFKPHRVTDPKLKRMITWQKARWNDEWWTPGQAAAYHGVKINNIGLHIYAGKIQAVKWGNHWIKRSEATKPGLKFFIGKGSYEPIDWSPKADAFLLLARAIGLSYSVIGKLMVWPHQRIAFRLSTLRRDNKISSTIKVSGLNIIQLKNGSLFADWREYGQRFPSVERAVRRFVANELCTADELRLVLMLIRSCGEWAARTEAQRTQASHWTYYSKATVHSVMAAYAALRAWGVDPLQMNEVQL